MQFQNLLNGLILTFGLITLLMFCVGAIYVSGHAYGKNLDMMSYQ